MATQTVIMKEAEVVVVTPEPVTHWDEMHRHTFTVTRAQLNVAVFSGMVGGAIKGGPVGMTRGTIGGAVIGQCLSGGGNGNGGGNRAGSSNCSGSNVGGTCSR